MHTRREAQSAFGFMNWGGARVGAGRKARFDHSGKRRCSHERRPHQSRHHPLHVTVRVAGGLPSIRGAAAYRAVCAAFANGRERFGMRLIHYSVQSNHIHVLVEACDRTALSRGMKGLCVRLARALNSVWRRVGCVFPDRFHARALKSPRQMRNALVYVLHNGHHHRVLRGAFDSYASVSRFDGWDEGVTFANDPTPQLARPDSWLLRTGWRKAGPISVWSRPIVA